MVYVAQVGYATSNILYKMFIRNMSEDDHVTYDDVTRRLTFFTYNEEVWHEDNVDLDKLYDEWEKEYAQ